jgi:pyruvate/2-oxoglutarate dehydrogenase complex dihydrolipoamide dehydrogenase (E3) component
MPAALLPHDPHDQRLREQVHPADWVNPAPRSLYDLVVLGAGAGGLVSAAGAAAFGIRVALVEKNLLGGECLADGCVPSKALVRCARAAADVRRAGALGVRVGETAVDFPAVVERMRRVRADLASNDSAARFRGLGVDVFLGEGRFASRDLIAVGAHNLRFRQAIVATGSHTAIPDLPGLAESGFLTNETIFALTELPQRLAIVGAGATGCELAQAFARFGSRVTLFDHGGRVLSKEDHEATKRIEAALVADGITLIDAPIQRIASQTIYHARGEAPFDRILIATGRVPRVDGLGLDAAGIAFDPKIGIHVDDRLRTTNRRVYAVGDVATTQRFTHAADAMARLALRNALFGGRGRFSHLVIPRCTFTDPELAAVGHTEEEARQAGIRFRSFVVEFTQLDRAVLEGEAGGFVKVLVREGSDRIIGATILGSRAGEMIGEIALAMTVGTGLRALALTVHPYPTFGEAIRKVADAYNRTRLTPFRKKLLRWWIQL